MNCPVWFKYVSCVIVYNSGGNVFLGKRRDGEAEAGKWAILGGSGAFGESQNRHDFARRELEYDVRLKINPDNLKPLTTLVLCLPEGYLLIEDYFCYQQEGGVQVTENKKAPAEGRWFSMKAIQEMAQNRQIAFDNYKTLKKLFEEQILKGQAIK
mgnify:CR=1 FL=1